MNDIHERVQDPRHLTDMVYELACDFQDKEIGENWNESLQCAAVMMAFYFEGKEELEEKELEKATNKVIDIYNYQLREGYIPMGAR